MNESQLAKLTPELPAITLPFWMDGKTLTDEPIEPVMMMSGLQAFFNRIRTWLTWPLEQMDASECDPTLLNLLAWERSIPRLNNEPIDLYRLRVFHAFANAKDAGSTAGMKAIFGRLGFDIIDINERVEGFDWDQIEILMLESQFAEREELINAIIKSYGRTCRRYFLSAVAAANTDERFALIEFEKEVIG
ncbi:phage tail protein [Shewanella surugensis]|uniref:Phage tail protein n=1 Tax=Shewanella surugensis TaxID=212020 RepID=A0ABT0L7Z8_9GAMM|nr:phage tail protein [Shewanella surugensis]MCL1123520.1 phage tail protein [Shewanella surugensis]